MRVTRPVSMSPTRRHDWRSCTGWRLDARLTVGRCLRVTALTASLKHLPCVNTITISLHNTFASRNDDFFDFLKALQLNNLRHFLPIPRQKKLREGQKNAQKNGRRTPAGRRGYAPSTSSSKTRKKSSEIFQASKKIENRSCV